MSVPGAGCVLSCCSTVDLTAAKLASLGIGWLVYSNEVGGVVYLDDLWESGSPGGFYDELARGADAKTALPPAR